MPAPADHSEPQSGPLAGLKVLDLTHIASGPFATMLLADMGADVIKVERPGSGDGSRQMDRAIRGTDSGYYLGINKNKRSIALDLASGEGKSTVRSLASNADVLIENLRPGAMDRLGLGYDAIAEIKPDIIYCSISGFGEIGHLRDGIAYDIIGQALSGIMSITGETDGPPAKCGAPISDLSSGLFAAIGVLAALNHRHRTGEGQRVTTSLIGASVGLLAPYVTSRALGTPYQRLGSAHNTLAPYQAFAGSDRKFFIVAAGNDRFFTALARTIGRPDLVDDPRYRTNALRADNQVALAETLQQRFDDEPAIHWLTSLKAADVPVSPIYDIGDMVAEEQVRLNGYVIDIEQPGIGRLPMVATPLTFSASPTSAHRPAPGLDEHREEILRVARDPQAWLTG